MARENIIHLRLNDRERDILRRYAAQEQVTQVEALRLLIRNAPLHDETLEGR